MYICILHKRKKKRKKITTNNKNNKKRCTEHVNEGVFDERRKKTLISVLNDNNMNLTCQKK